MHWIYHLFIFSHRDILYIFSCSSPQHYSSFYQRRSGVHAKLTFSPDMSISAVVSKPFASCEQQAKKWRTINSYTLASSPWSIEMVIEKSFQAILNQK